MGDGASFSIDTRLLPRLHRTGAHRHGQSKFLPVEVGDEKPAGIWRLASDGRRLAIDEWQHGNVAAGGEVLRRRGARFGSRRSRMPVASLKFGWGGFQVAQGGKEIAT